MSLACEIGDKMRRRLRLMAVVTLCVGVMSSCGGTETVLGSTDASPSTLNAVTNTEGLAGPTDAEVIESYYGVMRAYSAVLALVTIDNSPTDTPDVAGVRTFREFGISEIEVVWSADDVDAAAVAEILDLKHGRILLTDEEAIWLDTLLVPGRAVVIISGDGLVHVASPLDHERSRVSESGSLGMSELLKRIDALQLPVVALNPYDCTTLAPTTTSVAVSQEVPAEVARLVAYFELLERDRAFNLWLGEVERIVDRIEAESRMVDPVTNAVVDPDTNDLARQLMTGIAEASLDVRPMVQIGFDLTDYTGTPTHAVLVGLPDEILGFAPVASTEPTAGLLIGELRVPRESSSIGVYLFDQLPNLRCPGEWLGVSEPGLVLDGGQVFGDGRAVIQLDTLTARPMTMEEIESLGG